MNRLVIHLERGLVQQVYSEEPLELIVVDKSGAVAWKKEAPEREEKNFLEPLGNDTTLSRGDTCVDSTVVDNAFKIAKKICGHCHKYINNPTKFCATCGQPLCDCDESIYCYSCISASKCFQGCACGCGRCAVYYEHKQCPYQYSDRVPECRLGNSVCQMDNEQFDK